MRITENSIVMVFTGTAGQLNVSGSQIKIDTYNEKDAVYAYRWSLDSTSSMEFTVHDDTIGGPAFWAIYIDASGHYCYDKSLSGKYYELDTSEIIKERYGEVIDVFDRSNTSWEK